MAEIISFEKERQGRQELACSVVITRAGGVLKADVYGAGEGPANMQVLAEALEEMARQVRREMGRRLKGCGSS